MKTDEDHCASWSKSVKQKRCDLELVLNARAELTTSGQAFPAGHLIPSRRLLERATKALTPVQHA